MKTTNNVNNISYAIINQFDSSNKTALNEAQEPSINDLDQGPPASISAFGVNFIGVDPRLISRLNLNMSIPLRRGKNHFLAMGKDARVKIQDSSVALINLLLGRNDKGQLTLKSFCFEVNHSIIIKNPSSSFEEQEGKKWHRALKDKIADLKLKSIEINEHGKVIINGKIKAFHTIKKRLPAEMGTIEVPVLDETMLMKLGIFKEVLGKDSPTLEALRDRFQIKSLISSLGAITKEASYDLSLTADPSNMLIAKDNNFFRGPTSPINFDLAGTIDLTPPGDLVLVVDGKKSKFSGSLGTYTPHLEAKISNLVTPQPKTIALHGHLSGVGSDLRIDTFSKQEVKSVMPRRRQIAKAVPMPQNEDEYNATFGAPKVSLKAIIDTHLEITKLSKAKSGKGSIDVAVTGGTGSLSITAEAPYARTHERGIQIGSGGSITAKVDAKEIRYHNKSLQNAQIRVGVGLSPDEKTKEQFPEIKPLKFKYKADIKGPGQVSITPPAYGVTRFLRLVKNLEGHDERVDTLQTKTNIGPIGTTEYFNQVEKIAGLKVKKAETVELLIDGIRSMPKRLSLIDNAQNSICFQTLAFKADASGWQYAEALVRAAKRGVKVYGVVDSLGNIESFKDLEQPNIIYQYLTDNGVELHLYNDFLEKGVRSIFAVAQRNAHLFSAYMSESLMGIAELVRFLEAVASLADDTHNVLSRVDRDELRQGIHIMLGGKAGVSPHNAIFELKKAIRDNMTTLDEILLAIKRVGDASYRWHEKYLIVDGVDAIVGGMNIADEYLRGGSNEQVVIKGKAQPVWRDSDVYVRGPVVDDIVANFKNNWLHVAKADLHIKRVGGHVSPQDQKGTYSVGMIHHRPFEDGDHNVTNFLLYNLRTLEKGEKAWFETPYFLPRGVLRPLQKEMVRAAQRGVDLRILTNSERTSDFGPLVEAAVFDTRELLRHGARVFHRNHERMVHAKVYVLGDKLTMIGSWNMDNRSAAHDSEDICAIYDHGITKEMSDQLLVDMFDQSDEVKLEDLERRTMGKEVRSAAMLLMGELA